MMTYLLYFLSLLLRVNDDDENDNGDSDSAEK